MTTAPSKPAFEAIVNAGAYHISKCTLSANTDPQINTQVSAGEKFQQENLESILDYLYASFLVFIFSWKILQNFCSIQKGNTTT